MLFNKRIRASLTVTKHGEDALEAERNSLEKKVSERTEELLHVERERYQELERVAQFGSLSQGLFHDLMSPLSSISLYLEKIQTSQDTQEARDIIQKTARASQRMNSFMQSIRKSIGTASDILPAKANVTEELSVVRDMLMYKARTLGVTVHIPDELSDQKIDVKIHPVRMQQIFINLISNALDACEGDSFIEKQVTVLISKQKEGLSIVVSDGGCGISTDTLTKMWERSFTTKKRGTGRGLATVKEIVEHELHGSISVESIEHRGATFTIYIPNTSLA